VRPNINVPDGETIKALLTHRFQAMTDFHRNVLKPALREAGKGASLPRALRKGLSDDGRWLKPDAREQLQAWIAQNPSIRALVEHRARLAAVLEARGNDAAATLQNLQAWCKDAEASGIRALEDFSARLKGYRLHAA
jgi:stearoyl-CoA desaturase (delta-9 desaturase)